MNRYEFKQARRRERLLARAQRMTAESSAAYKHAQAMASAIPFGQPILVGHHSERRDRRYRERIHRTYGKAFALSDAAESAERRAAAVGSGGISSDDPDAVEKLRAQLVQLEQWQETMRKANACVRKNNRGGLVKLGFDEARAAQLFEKDFAGRVGFADYQLKNNNANIRRIKARIAELSVQAQRVDHEEEAGGLTIRHDTTENRVMLLFAAKPAQRVRDLLKRWGFRWSPTNGAWQRQLNNAGILAAVAVRDALAAEEAGSAS
jgi:Domain of unknown function (DUF3560)